MSSLVSMQTSPVVRLRNVEDRRVTPFLKWAGGKRWFCHNHLDLLPKVYNRYLEPFLGSGAVFFRMRPDFSILGDKNVDLIDTYNAIKRDPDSVWSLILDHNAEHSKEYYYHQRSLSGGDDTVRAARFIYLNRSCWNGLYRVNLLGQFNVPIGTKTSVLLPTDDFRGVSDALQASDIVSGDFEAVIDRAEDEDFVFVDPPYTVKHNNNGFVKYNESIFSWDDQVRLRNSIVRAVNRGASCIVTNAHHPSIHELYEGVGEIRIAQRSSVISASSNFRGKAEEVVIVCQN